MDKSCALRRQELDQLPGPGNSFEQKRCGRRGNEAKHRLLHGDRVEHLYRCVACFK